MHRYRNGSLGRAADFLSRAFLAGSVILSGLYPTIAFATIQNTVVISGFDSKGNPIAPATDTITVDTVGPAPAISVAKSAVLNDDDGTTGLSAGDTISYQISLSNDGNVSVTGISLTDTISQGPRALSLDAAPIVVSGDDTDPGTLNIGEVWIYNATYTIQQADIDDGGDIANNAVFDGTSGTTPVTAQDDAVVALNTTASIAVDKTPVTSSYARPGDLVEWTITVTNSGSTTLTAINVTDDTADNLVCQLSGTSTIATLAPGGTETCTATYAAQVSDIGNPTIENTVSVTGVSGSLTVGASDTATVPREDANLVTVKELVSANPSPLVGETVTYEITVTNAGTATATQITLTDDLPAGLTPTAGNGAVSAGNYDAVSGIWTIPTLTNGESATLTLEGTVDAGQGGNVITNQVSAAVARENDPTTVGDVLIAVFTPVPLPIIAVDDVVPSPVDSALAVAGVINVFDQDTLGGAPVDDTTVAVSTVGTWPAGITLNPDGTIDVAAGTPTGTYVVEYQICEIADPDNCSTATVTIPVVSALPLLSGTVYLDVNQNGTFDPVDDPLPSYVVQLWQNGVVVEETTTDANGEYEFSGFVPGTYDIVFLEPGGTFGVGIIEDIVVGAGETIVDQNQIIDPSGVVYDSLSGAPVSGATVTIVDGTGTPLPPACVLPGQQNQVTDGAGDYRFDIIAGADPACPVGKTEYAIEITPPVGYLPLPSAIIAPEPGLLDPAVCAEDFIPGGACNLSDGPDAPSVAAPSPYYLGFLIGAGDQDVVYNHIPLDPVPSPSTSGLTIEKLASQSVVRLGDTISYTITGTNALLNPYTDVYVIDTLPVGVTYTPGTATLNGSAVEPAINGRILEFGPFTIPGSGSFEITLSARIGQQVSASELTNTAQIVDQNGVALTNVARATVRLEAEPIFTCSPIIGRVYDDLNRNGYPDDGEPGLPGVRLATVTGLLITTDQYGRYSVPCAEMPDPDTGDNFILKLDTRSLPSGYRVTSENPRVIRVTAGKMSSLNFGAAISRVVDIELSSTAFARNSAEPSAQLSNGIDRLVQALETEPSVLRITYFENGEGTDLARKRVAGIEQLIRQKLRRSQLGVDLWIETTVRSR